jgi:hypothetical protein
VVGGILTDEELITEVDKLVFGTFVLEVVPEPCEVELV